LVAEVARDGQAELMRVPPVNASRRAHIGSCARIADERASRAQPWEAQPVDTDQWFRVTFVAPSGFKHEVTGKAPSEVEAVRLADETLEYVERIGIRDYLEAGSTTVRPPAQLYVERIRPDEATPGFGLVITAPGGTVKRK
jgi:hypothetical protein